MGKIIVGLDIGTTKIACFVGRKNEHGKIEILSMGKTESLGVMRGMVSNIEKTIQSIDGAVKEAEERIEGELKSWCTTHHPELTYEACLDEAGL